jgi:hypothetical protein
MLITAIEARVPEDRVGELERAYREGLSSMPSAIVETFLARDLMDPTIFRIVTVWESREALVASRASGQKPKGLQIFEAVGAEHKHSASEVVVHGKG